MAVLSPGARPADPTDAVQPLDLGVALRRLAACAATTVRLLARGRLHHPGAQVGLRVTFADGTTARVYRETVVDRRPLDRPVVLVVRFRMRMLRGPLGQAYFRAVSLLNTPLFAGFPGFATKLWLAADEHGAYRGLYEWDDVELAEQYVRALWWPLAVISEVDSIRYRILPGRRRDDVVLDRDGRVDDDDAWWRPVAAARDPAP
jgi:hypothetical protein